MAQTEKAEALARRTAQTAVRALLYEVAVTPKPGLVDRADSGAHTDMDFFTFVDSAAALWPYFYEVTLIGHGFSGPLRDLLPALRPAGLAAEAAMLKATGGVNTHKGLIFSLGVLCACVGRLCAVDAAITEDSLLDAAAQVCHALPGELDIPGGEDTKGRSAFSAHRVTGIRGEMAAGLPAVRRHGYPALRELVREGHGLNDAGALALLHLVAVVEDTNIIGRAGLGALRDLQAEVHGALAEKTPPELLIYAGELNKRLIAKNLSPGGSADLLAVCMFLLFLSDFED